MKYYEETILHYCFIITIIYLSNRKLDEINYFMSTGIIISNDY